MSTNFEGVDEVVNAMVKGMRKNRENNSGMALVSVIVVIGFIAALVSIILVTTVINFKMKAVNERSKDTFYSAEQALDEVNIGLQRIISDSMSEAYVEILESYSEYAENESMTDVEKDDIDAKRAELLKTRYREILWEKLQKDDNNTEYDVTVLEGFLKDTTKWHGDADNGYGAILVAVDDDGITESKVGKMIAYENEGVVLKNFKVYYKDAGGFVSVIKTDIRMAYPDFRFDRTSEIPDIIYYSIVADEKADFADASGLNVDLKGKVYANELTVENRKLTAHSGDDITVKYDVALSDNASFVTKKATDANEDDAEIILWAQNLVADSSKFDIKGNINVSNDINLKGNEPSFKLEGDFTGFGNDISNPYKSSSLLINGKNTSVDLSHALNFILGGHAFAGTSDAKQGNSDNIDGLTMSTNARMALPTKNSDIFMSESIAPKYDQLMYLIPGSAIGVDKNTGISKYGKNPLTLEEYAVITGDDYNEVDTSVEINELAGDTLSNYIVDGAGNKFKRLFVRVSDANVGGGGLVYYYLDFTGNETLASEYLSLYYNNNKESADKYMRFYIDEITMPNSSAALKLAGNYYEYSPSKDSDASVDMGNGNTLSTAADLDAICKDKWSAYKARVKSEEVDICESFEKDDYTHQLYFEKTLADTTQESTAASSVGNKSYLTISMHDFVSRVGEKATANGDYEFGASGNTVTITMGSDEVAYISENVTEPVVVNKETVALVISKGDVKIDVAHFKGLVICDGTVTFTENVESVEADPAMVQMIMEMAYTYQADPGSVPEEIGVLNLLLDNDQIGSGNDDKVDPSKKRPGGMISYENWTKE